MHQKTALLVCTLFVLFLLYIDRKQAPSTSHFLWLPTLWMLSVAIKPLGIWFGVANDAEGSPLDRIVLSGFLVLCMFLLVWKKERWIGAVKEQKWLMALLAYMIVSIFWSEMPFISFKRWIRELLGVSMAFLVLCESDPRQALESLFRRSIYILIPFSMLLIKYFPDFGRRYNRWTGEVSWLGVTTQKNGLGRLCIIAAFFLLWSIYRRWQRREIHVVKYKIHVDIFLLVITLWLLKGPPHSYSATAIVSLTAGLTTFIILLWMKHKKINLSAKPLILITAIIIFLGVTIMANGGSIATGFASMLGRNETFTGRTAVWADLFSIVKQHPLFGCGFGGFWTPEVRILHDITEGHCGYLDLLLEQGFVGLMFVSMFLFSCCRKAQRLMNYDYDWGALWIVYLIMALVHNITETSLNSLVSHMIAIILFLSVCSSAVTSPFLSKAGIYKLQQLIKSDTTN